MSRKNALFGGEVGSYGTYTDMLIMLSDKAAEFEELGISKMKIAAAFARFTSDYVTRVHDESLGSLDNDD